MPTNYSFELFLSPEMMAKKAKRLTVKRIFKAFRKGRPLTIFYSAITQQAAGLMDERHLPRRGAFQIEVRGIEQRNSMWKIRGHTVLPQETYETSVTLRLWENLQRGMMIMQINDTEDTVEHGDELNTKRVDPHRIFEHS